MINKKIIILLMVIVILLSACSQITEEQAKMKAIRFVEDRVKFYTKRNDTDLNFPSYEFSSVTSYKEGPTWIILIKITSLIDNITKDTDIFVEVNSRNGKITEFNGQPVTHQ